jgi:YbgC/YbaW family acyl-CoA thioester hydrolase
MSRTYITQRRVEFGDTDMAGIMHFANFFRFMESAETEFLRSLGLTVSWRDAGGRWGFPRVHATCEYLQPARFEDLLTITVTVENVGQKSVRYRFDFTNEQGQTIAVGRITAVFCRSIGPDRLEAVEIPPEVRQRLNGSSLSDVAHSPPVPDVP